jgi:hypothetical protein
MAVDGQSLDTRTLGDRANGRRQRSDRRVQPERRFNDPAARLRLALSAFPEPVAPHGMHSGSLLRFQ